MQSRPCYTPGNKSLPSQSNYLYRSSEGLEHFEGSTKPLWIILPWCQRVSGVPSIVPSVPYCRDFRGVSGVPSICPHNTEEKIRSFGRLCVLEIPNWFALGCHGNESQTSRAQSPVNAFCTWCNGYRTIRPRIICPKKWNNRIEKT